MVEVVRCDCGRQLVGGFEGTYLSVKCPRCKTVLVLDRRPRVVVPSPQTVASSGVLR